MPRYKRKFYESSREGLESARAIVPGVLKLMKPRSVVDLGCGVGSWLAVFKELGAEEIAGYDGEWVHLDDLLIPKECFHRHDLTKPLQTNRRFDLAVSVEVAEHLRAEHALAFVQTLTGLANVVLFSAAIPFQGGTNHFNEQWPSYWVQLFAKSNFVVVDCLRMKSWNNPQVKWWYAQNVMLFVAEQHLGDYPALMDAHQKENLWGASLVHPKRWEKQADPRNLRLGRSIKQCFSIMARSFRRR